MDRFYISDFIARQEMKNADLEIFHRDEPSFDQVLPHSHDFVEMYYLIGDGIAYIAGNSRFSMTSGSLMVITPGDIHWVEATLKREAYERIVLWISIPFIEQLTALIPDGEPVFSAATSTHLLTIPDHRARKMVESLLFSLLHEKKADDANSEYMIRLITAQLLIHVFRLSNNTVKAISPKSIGIMQVYQYIEDHIYEPLNVSGLAEKFYMDENTMNRHFRQLLGMTTGECIRRKRLEAVLELIYQGMSIRSASLQCGFSDYSAFYRAFHHAYGVSPREYVGIIRDQQSGSLVKMEPEEKPHESGGQL